MPGRIRTVKPEFLTDVDLWEAHFATGLPLHLVYLGLWCHADREGRFEWSPRYLKTQILPYCEDIDMAECLDALAAFGFLLKYRPRGDAAGKLYGAVITFASHQVINNRERSSLLPAPADCEIIPVIPPEIGKRDSRVVDAWSTRGSFRPDAAQGEGKGREGKGTGTRKGRERESRKRNGSGSVAAETATEQESPVPEASFILNDGAVWLCPQDYFEQLQLAFPGVDTRQELIRAALWCINNPTRRKTPLGIRRYIGNWFERQQNSGRRPVTPTNPPAAGGRFPLRDLEI